MPIRWLDFAYFPVLQKFLQKNLPPTKPLNVLNDAMDQQYQHEQPTHIVSIDLDRRHLAQRDGSNWTLSAKDPDGVYRTIEHWSGNRRSLYRRMDQLGIVPTAVAESRLAEIPEGSFREDAPLPGGPAKIIKL